MSVPANQAWKGLGIAVKFNVSAAYDALGPAVGDKVVLNTTPWEVDQMPSGTSTLFIGNVIAYNPNDQASTYGTVVVQTRYGRMEVVQSYAQITEAGLGVWRNSKVYRYTNEYEAAIAGHCMILEEALTADLDVTILY